MCISYRVQMMCGHTETVPAPCEFRDEGIMDWRANRHPCPKKIVCRTDHSHICTRCYTRNTRNNIDKTNRPPSLPELSIMQLLIRNEGFLRKRKELRPLSPFTPPANPFASVSDIQLKLQLLTNEAFLQRRQSRRAIQTHMKRSGSRDDSKESYAFYCETAQLDQGARTALKSFRDEMYAQPEKLATHSVSTQTDLESKLQSASTNDQSRRALELELKTVKETFSQRGHRLVGLVLEGEDGALEFVTETLSARLDDDALLANVKEQSKVYEGRGRQTGKQVTGSSSSSKDQPPQTRPTRGLRISIPNTSAESSSAPTRRADNSRQFFEQELLAQEGLGTKFTDEETQILLNEAASIYKAIDEQDPAELTESWENFSRQYPSHTAEQWKSHWNINVSLQVPHPEFAFDLYNSRESEETETTNDVALPTIFEDNPHDEDCFGDDKESLIAVDRAPSRLGHRDQFDEFCFDFHRTMKVGEDDEENKENARPPSRRQDLPLSASMNSHLLTSPRTTPRPSQPQKSMISPASYYGLQALDEIRSYLCMPASMTASQIFSWSLDNGEVFLSMRQGRRQLAPVRQAHKRDIGTANMNLHGWTVSQEFLALWDTLSWDELTSPPEENYSCFSSSSDEDEDDDDPEPTCKMGAEASPSEPKVRRLGGTFPRLENFRSSQEVLSIEDSPTSVPVPTISVPDDDTLDPLVFVEKFASPRASDNRRNFIPSPLRISVSLIKQSQILAEEISLPPSPPPVSQSGYTVSSDDDISEPDSMMEFNLGSEGTFTFPKRAPPASTGILSATAAEFIPTNRDADIQGRTPRQSKRAERMKNLAEQWERKYHRKEIQQAMQIPLPPSPVEEEQMAEVHQQEDSPPGASPHLTSIKQDPHHELQHPAKITGSLVEAKSSSTIHDHCPLPVSYTTSAGAVLLTRIRNLLDLPRHFTAAQISTFIITHDDLIQGIRDGRVLLPIQPGEGGYRDEARSELLQAIGSLDWEEVEEKRGLF